MASSSSQIDGGVKLEEQQQQQPEQQQQTSPRLAKRGTKRISEWAGKFTIKPSERRAHERRSREAAFH